VNSEAAARFGRIGAILSRFPNQLVLEGHTDSVPIHNERFSSNWALSTARSMAVMELLERGSAIVPERFSIAGSANNAPVSTNDTEAGRSRNRRVDIAVLDEPGPVSFDPGSVQRGSPGRN
jgi:chemotaxis protein MotB